MTSFSIADAPAVPDWLVHFKETGRKPFLRHERQWLFRLTTEDRAQFSALRDAGGVELVIDENEVTEWDVLNAEDFAQLAGELFESSHRGRGDEGTEVFRVEVGECAESNFVMTLVTYDDGVLSSADVPFDEGYTFERRRYYDSVEGALDHPDERFFQRRSPLRSIRSAVHSAEQISRRLFWTRPVEPHDFSINGEWWRFDVDHGVTRVETETPDDEV